VSVHRSDTRASALALVCSLAALAMAVGPAFAAILGSLAPATAAPGDWVVLTTDAGPNDLNVYQSLAAEGSLPAFLQRADPASPGNSCDTPIGTMAWIGGVGTLRFQVPDVPAGGYWVLVLTQGACERFGVGTGILTLTVRPPTAADLSPAVIAVAVATAAAVSVGLLVIRRRRRDRRPRSETHVDA
jgi:hypothetical protein